MAIALEDFAISDTDYVNKHNRNNTVLENAIGYLQSTASSVAANQNLPYMLQALFGNDVTPNVIDEFSCIGSIVGGTVELTAGYAYLPGIGAVCYNPTTTAVDLGAQVDGTYYITMDITGAPTFNTTGVDGIYSVVKAAGVLGSLTKLATNSIDLEVPVTVAHGGSSLITRTAHAIQIGNGTSAITQSAVGANGTVFMGNTGADPTFSSVNYPRTATTAGRLLYVSSSNIVSDLTSALNGVLVTNNTGAGIPSILVGPGATSRMLLSNAAAAPSWSTSTIPTSAGASGKVLISDGTNYILSTATFPGTVGAVGTFLRSDGTNWVATTSTIPTSAGATGKILISDGTNYILSTATYPATAGAAGTFLRSDGTNWLTSTLILPNTLTLHALYVGNGTSSPTALAVGATGTALIGNTGADPSWSTQVDISILNATSIQTPSRFGSTTTILTDVGGSSGPMQGSLVTNTTANATLSNRLFSMTLCPTVNAGVTDSGNKQVLYFENLRNYVYGTDASGTLATLTGITFSIGHYDTAAISPVTTNAFGCNMTLQYKSGTITTLYGYRVTEVTGGTCTNLYAFNSTITLATTHYNIYFSGTALSYFAGCIVMGSSSITNTSVFFELSSTTQCLLLSRMSTANRDAMTGVSGMIVYNTTTTKFNAYENGAWVAFGAYSEGTFTPTVTLVGGAGNTVPVYSTNTGRYTRNGNRVFVDIYLTGDGGAEGAGTGQVNIALPIAAGASNPTSQYPCGYALNNITEYVIEGQIAGGASVMTLKYVNLLTTTALFTGADQNNTTRTIRLQFFYEV